MQEQALLEPLSRHLPSDLASRAVFSVCMTFNRTGRGLEAAAARDYVGFCSNLPQREFAASAFSNTKFIMNSYGILSPKFRFPARVCRSFLSSSGRRRKRSSTVAFEFNSSKESELSAAIQEPCKPMYNVITTNFYASKGKTVSLHRKQLYESADKLEYYVGCQLFTRWCEKDSLICPTRLFAIAETYDNKYSKKRKQGKNRESKRTIPF